MHHETVIGSHRDQYALILVGVFGSLVAAAQGVTAFGHALVLWFIGKRAPDLIPEAAPLDPTAGDYLRGAAFVSLNLALAAVCIGAITVAVRSTRRGSTTTPWICLGVVGVVALLTFTGTTWFDMA